MEYLRSAIQRVRESLFFLPTLVVIACLILAWLTTSLDRAPENVAELPFLLSVTVDGGRVIAGAVAGATITVAAIVFSITALTSQLAATQYTPRAVAGFFEDRLQQLVIGLVVGTFAYSLLVLAGLGAGTGPEDSARTSVSLTVVVVLGVVSAIAIVGYLDHSLRRMRIGAVVRRIAESTVQAVRRQYHKANTVDRLEEGSMPESTPRHVRARQTGWVRAVDPIRLGRLLPAGAVARVEVRVGEAVSAGELLLTFWPTDDDGDMETRVDVERAIHIGRDRTLEGDPMFGIRQLVDIGLRALSPGINDPTTAVDVVQHMKLPLREILIREAPGRVFIGSDRQRVFLAEAPTRSDIVHAAFGELRLAADDQPAVLRALIETLSDLIRELEAEELEGRVTALREEAHLTVEAVNGAGFPEPDKQRILQFARRRGLYDDDDSADTAHSST